MRYEIRGLDPNIPLKGDIMKPKLLGTISNVNDDVPQESPGFQKLETITVERTCESCYKHILKAAKSVDGVLNATWDETTEKLRVEFDSGKTNADAIQRAIAEAGHSTPLYKKQEKFYTEMPECCQYRENPEKE